MTTVYVLLLENNKYYIGKTQNIDFRLDDHFNLNGSVWTSKYKPLKLLEKIDNCEDFDEDKYTLKYMNIYGIDNVRGGSFCQLKLSNENYITLNKMLNNNNNKCFICGNPNHFVKDCNKKEEYKSLFQNKCDICKRFGHTSENCYAKTYKNGNFIKKEQPIIKQNKCIIKCHLNKSIGWNSDNHISLQSTFSSINELFILVWVNDDYFRIKHPDKNIYSTSDLSPSKKENAGLFKIEDKKINNNIIECFISTNNKYLWVDEKWYGYNLQNDSNNKGKWEKFYITLL